MPRMDLSARGLPGPRRLRRGGLAVAAVVLFALLMVAPGVLSRSPGQSPTLVRESPSGLPAPLTASRPSASPAVGCPITGLVPPSLDHRRSVVAGGTGGLSAHSVDPRAVPNTGFEFNVTGYAMPSGGSGSFLLTEQETVADQILAMGLFANSTLTATGTVPFWAVIDNSTGHFISCGYTFNAPPTPGQNVQFQALNIGGRTWEVLYRGQPFSGSNNITMNGTQSTWTGGVGVVTLANWNGTAWAPSDLALPVSMRVLTQGGWYLAHPVAASWNGTAPPTWGEAGSAQRGYLAPGALDIGTSVPTVTNGTELWTSAAPTPLVVTMATGSTSLQGGGSSSLSVRALAAGVAIPGLSVALASSGGGTFSPALPWNLSAQGYANGTYTAPLVSSPVSVVLSASVGNGQFQGTGQLTVAVAPTVATVALTLSSSQVAEGGIVNVTVTVRAGTQGISGVNLSFTASVGGGAFSPIAPWVTDLNGAVKGSYVAPPTSGPVQLVFSIESVGFSGRAYAWLNVTGSGGGSPSSPWDGAAMAIDVALAAVLVVLVALYARARSHPSRRMGDAESAGSSAEAPGPAAGEEGVVRAPAEDTASSERAPSTSRSCPGCGASLHEVDGRFCPRCGAPIATTGKFASQTDT